MDMGLCNWSEIRISYLVKHYWWEIIALAKMVEHYNYVASNKVSSMLSYFVSTQHICCSLEDLERE